MSWGEDSAAGHAAAGDRCCGAADRWSEHKEQLATTLDLTSAHWSTVAPAGGDLEYAFVPHDDGVTYVALRSVSSRDGSRPVLVFTPSEWDAFLAGVRDGEFDRPQD